VLSIRCRLIIILSIYVRLTLTLAKVCPHLRLITNKHIVILHTILLTLQYTFQSPRSAYFIKDKDSITRDIFKLYRVGGSIWHSEREGNSTNFDSSNRVKRIDYLIKIFMKVNAAHKLYSILTRECYYCENPSYVVCEYSVKLDI